MPGILEEIGSERRSERIASLRSRIAELRQKIAEYRAAKNAQKMGPEAGLADFQLLAGMKPNESPAGDQQSVTQPSSPLAQTAPSGPLAASSRQPTPQDVQLPNASPLGVLQGPEAQYLLGRARDFLAPIDYEKQPTAVKQDLAVAHNLLAGVMSMGLLPVEIADRITKDPKQALNVAMEFAAFIPQKLATWARGAGLDPTAGGMIPQAKILFGKPEAEVRKQYPQWSEANKAVVNDLAGTLMAAFGAKSMLSRPGVNPVDQARAGALGPETSLSRPEGPTASRAIPEPVLSPADVQQPAALPIAKPPEPITSGPSLPPVEPSVPPAAKGAEVPQLRDAEATAKFDESVRQSLETRPATVASERSLQPKSTRLQYDLSMKILRLEPLKRSEVMASDINGLPDGYVERGGLFVYDPRARTGKSFMISKPSSAVVKGPQVEGAGTEVVTPIQEAGGGVGGPGISTSLGAKLELELRAQRAKGAAVSVDVQREARKPGVAQFFRRPIAFVEQFGQHAKAAMERIVLSARDAQVEIWRRDNLMNEIQREIPKQDWGKRGEKFWAAFEGRKIEDIMADPALQPGTKSAATKLRKFLDDDRTAQLERIREKNRGWVTADAEKVYREELGLRRGEPIGAEGDPARAEIQKRVDARLKEMVPESWRIEDYLPHVFPGEYFVKIKNAEGNWTTVGSAGTRMEAMSKVAEVAHNMDITDPTMFQVVNKGFSAPDVIRLGTGRYWAMFKELKESMKISDADIHAALAGKIGTRTGRQKWAGPLQHRTGTEGFIKDFPRAMEFYNRAIARNISATKMARDVTPMIEKIRSNNPQLADYLQSNFDTVWGMKRSVLSEAFDASLQNTPGLRDFVSPFALERWTAAVVKQPIVYLKWKLSPRAQMLNSLQLAQTGIKLSTAELAEGIRFAHTEAGHAAMKNHGVEAFAGGRFTEFGKLRATQLAGTETFNQRSIWSSFYRKGIKAGMDDVAANDYAYLKGNLESQFAYNPADVPPVMRGPVGSTILMFKRFTVNDLELGAGLIKDRNFPAAGKWLAAKLLIGGLKGATSPVTWLAGGYLTHKIYNQISEEYGKPVADVIAYGIPGLVGLDMSYSMQMVDVPRETALGNLGPVGGDVERYAKALIGKNAVEPSTGKRMLNTALQGNPGVGRLIDGLGKLFRGADQGLYDFKTPDGKLKYRAGLKDLLIYALGGKTISDKVLVLGKPINEPLDIWTDALADAMAKRDKVLDEIAAKQIADPNYSVVDDVNRFNGLYTEFPITDKSINDRIEARWKSLTQNRAERMLQTAPKAIKGAMTPGGR